MQICDSCYGKDKKVVSASTPDFTAQFQATEKNSSELHLCYSCKKELNNLHDYVEWLVKAYGAAGFMEILAKAHCNR